MEFQAFSAQGNKVAFLLHGRYKERAPGKEFEAKTQHIVTLKEGKVTQREFDVRTLYFQRASWFCLYLVRHLPDAIGESPMNSTVGLPAQA